MAILITGGAGYIGSVTTELLRARGEAVVVLDNLSRGYRDAVDSEIPFYEGDVRDREAMLLSRRDVLIEIAVGIHDEGLARALAADHVAGLREPVVEKALEKHPPAPR